ncbi:MAG: HAMP domain-containing histidine kinase [Bdellovibrionaceae bacterium]|nr:HAMP domain-containing histidine kinase [Pseudobdellovibrionaceae bacterium]
MTAIFSLAPFLYLLFDRFLLITGEEIVKAWYYGEIVNLQEGQVHSAIFKNQGLLNQSPYIKSVVLVDQANPSRHLFSIGVQQKPLSKEFVSEQYHVGDSIVSVRNGFLSNLVFAKLPGKNGLFIFYEISSDFLIWSFLITLAFGILFVTYLMSLTAKVNAIERKKREVLRSDLLKRLSHDVNSPLLALSGISLQTKRYDADLYLRIEKSIESIRQLFAQTDKLDKRILEENADTATAYSNESAIDRDFEKVPVAPFLKDLYYQKRSEFSSREGLTFEISGLEDVLDCFVEINPADFKRHISNIFKNSIESMDGNLTKTLKMEIFNDDHSIIVKVSDSGKGIEESLLPNIGRKGFSNGKSGGRGLGLHFALESIKHWNGSFSIESEVGKGTSISIRLPKCETPIWFTSRINFSESKKIVFLDDDTAMLDRWISKYQLRSENCLSFKAAAEFENWFESGGQYEDELEFVFDYHLDGTNTGAAVIKKYGLERESTIATSSFLDKDIITSATSGGFKVFPKVLI